MARPACISTSSVPRHSAHSLGGKQQYVYESISHLHLELHQEKSLAEIRNLRRPSGAAHLGRHIQDSIRPNRKGRSLPASPPIAPPAPAELPPHRHQTRRGGFQGARCFG